MVERKDPYRLTWTIRSSSGRQLTVEFAGQQRHDEVEEVVAGRPRYRPLLLADRAERGTRSCHAWST
jgi:hypothetical protein